MPRSLNSENSPAISTSPKVAHTAAFYSVTLRRAVQARRRAAPPKRTGHCPVSSQQSARLYATLDLTLERLIASFNLKSFPFESFAFFVVKPSFLGSTHLGKKYQKAPPPDVTLPGRMWGMIGCKPPKPHVRRFPEGSRDGIDLVRLIRRWAASNHAFRQRNRFLSASKRRSLAKSVKHYHPIFTTHFLTSAAAP